MKAIILAAGVGNRLGDISKGKPKCLLEFEGKSLLHRHITLLKQLGITEILVVTGYRQDAIKDELLRLDVDENVRTVYNAEFRLGSVISLWTAREFLEPDDDVILMDADVLYDCNILKILVNTLHDNCFLLDRDFEPGDEPVKICVHDNTMVEFRKHIDTQLEFDSQGESVGFFRFSGKVSEQLARHCKEYIDGDQKETPYEEVIRDLLLQTPDEFNFEDITGLSWIEIDFPEDFSRAINEVLSKIN
jgi:choline kinase